MPELGLLIAFGDSDSGVPEIFCRLHYGLLRIGGKRENVVEWVASVLIISENVSVL